MANAQSLHRQLMLRVTIPVAGLVALLLGALLITVLLVAWYQTDIARNEQARLAEGAIKVRGEHIEKTALDYGAWDDAVDHLVVTLDADWADENIGKPIFQNLGFDMSFVISPGGSMLYGAIQGERTGLALDAVLKGGFRALVARQRAGPREGSVSGLILAGDRPAIAAVVPIRRLEVAAENIEPEHLLVIVDALDASLLDDLGRIYLLPKLRVVAEQEKEPAAVALLSESGDVVGGLAWDPARPGGALLRTAVPVWCVLTLGFALLTALIFRQARSAARMIAESEDRARHDPLTRLPNRVLFFERLDAASRLAADGGPSFAVLYIDLDGFKAVNDVHGHEAGDMVLREVGERIRTTIGPRDVAARLGGDEFALIVFERERAAEILAVGQSLIRSVSVPIAAGPDLMVSVGATIGATVAPMDATDPLVLLRNADQALFLGKRSGKGQVRFHLALAAQMAG